MLKVLRNNRGYSFIVMIMVVAFMILALMNSSIKYYTSLQGGVTKLRDLITSETIIEEFAAHAVSAAEMYAKTGPGLCPAGTTEDTFGRPFCWPNTICSQHQFANTADSVADVDYCLGFGTEDEGEFIAYQKPRPSSLKNKWDELKQWAAKAPEAIPVYLGHLASVAVAEKSFLPDISAGFPSNNVSNFTFTCDAATDGTTWCKQCERPAGPLSNLYCVRIRLCMLRDCTGADPEYTFASFGIYKE